LSLRGKVVAVVRPPDQAKDLAEAIESLGGTPYVAPLIEVKPTKRPEALIELVKATVAGKVDIIVFMSRNGVLQTFEAAEKTGLADPFKESIKGVTVVAVGPKTRQELDKFNVTEPMVPSEYSSQGIVKLLEKEDLRGKTIALPRAGVVDNSLRAALQRLGADVIEAAAYEIGPPSDKSLIKKFLEDLVAEKIDTIAFTSPSTVKSLLKHAEEFSLTKIVNERLRRVVIAAIGPTTRKALEDLGFKAQVVPSEYTVEALAKEIAAHFQARDEQSPSGEIYDLDRRILQSLQFNFPLVVRPWDALAERLGIDPQTLISRVRRLIDLGVIKKIGPFPDLKRVGFKASTLIGVKVPHERVEEIAEIVNRFSNVSHSYLREHQYNLWFTITARDTQEIQNTIDLLKKKTGLQDEDILNLPVVSTFKTDVRFNLL